MNTQDTSAGSISRKAVKKGVKAILTTATLTLFMGAVNVHAAVFDEAYIMQIKGSNVAMGKLARFGLDDEFEEYASQIEQEQEEVDEYEIPLQDEYEYNENGKIVEPLVDVEEEVLYEAEIAEDNTESEDETESEEVTVKSYDEIAPMVDYDTAKSYAFKLYSNTDLNTPSGISREDFISYVKGMPTRHDPTGFYKRNAGYIWDTCQEVKFNEFAFLGVSSWEGGWAAHGVSYNFYGTLGMRYSSEQDGIYGWVSYMKENYITPGGKYYSGPDLRSIGPTYCSNKWCSDVLDRVRDSALRG